MVVHYPKFLFEVVRYLVFLFRSSALPSASCTGLDLFAKVRHYHQQFLRQRFLRLRCCARPVAWFCQHMVGGGLSFGRRGSSGYWQSLHCWTRKIREPGLPCCDQRVGRRALSLLTRRQQALWLFLWWTDSKPAWRSWRHFVLEFVINFHQKTKENKFASAKGQTF